MTTSQVKVVTGKDGQTATPVAIATQLPPNVSAAFSAQQQFQVMKASLLGTSNVCTQFKQLLENIVIMWLEGIYIFTILVRPTSLKITVFAICAICVLLAGPWWGGWW